MIRLLGQADMTAIQKGISLQKRIGSVQLYETYALGRIFDSPIYHVTRNLGIPESRLFLSDDWVRSSNDRQSWITTMKKASVDWLLPSDLNYSSLFVYSSGVLRYPMIESKRPNSQRTLDLTMTWSSPVLLPASLSLRTCLVSQGYKDVQFDPSAPTLPQVDIHHTHITHTSHIHQTHASHLSEVRLTLWQPPRSDSITSTTLKTRPRSPAPSKSGYASQMKR